jgi:hypothetical protein
VSDPDAPRRRGSALRWWLLGGSLAAAPLLLGALGVVVAVLGASFTGCQGAAAPQPVSGVGPAPSAAALQDIPPERLRLYELAGQRFDIDWSFLASIGAQECNHDGCAGANSAGCAGPMQISYVRGSACSPGSGPTLWERFAVSAHPGRTPSVNDPADAVYTAARILREDMGAPPAGGSFIGYRDAACRYYGACADAAVSYAEEVMARAVQYGFTGSGSPSPTSPTLAQPVSSEAGECSAAAFAPEAASASEIVRVAESQLGQGERPPGSNCTLYGPCEEWCSLFVAWAWQHAGVALPGPTALYGYSGSLYSWSAQHGATLALSATPATGDAIFYGSGPDASVHVGIVVRVLADRRIVTIEGNFDDRVSRVGPFAPSRAQATGESGPVYGYAEPPSSAGAPA